MGDLGLFEGRPAMLIDGALLFMSPANGPHAMATGLTADALRAAFGPGFVVRVQSPLVLNQTTDPEPDVAVVPGTHRDYPTHPTTAALVAEVSDTTVGYDLGEKASLYAAGGVADYWVVDLNGRRLVVHRDPVADAAAPFGWRYASVTAQSPAAAITPLAAGSPVAVADLLP
jgi:Uma2 family endonuclease